jgi:Sigma-70 region 2
MAVSLNPRRWIPDRSQTPWTGPLLGRRVDRRPVGSPIRRCRSRSPGMPGALTATSIPTTGSRSVWRSTRLAKRRPRPSPSAPPAWYATSAWRCRCGAGMSVNTVSGAAWSPPSVWHCAVSCTQACLPGLACTAGEPWPAQKASPPPRLGHDGDQCRDEIPPPDPYIPGVRTLGSSPENESSEAPAMNVSSLLTVLVVMLVLSDTAGGRPTGDADAAIRQLYTGHARALRRYAERFCPDRASAEDIVQETFILAWRHVPQLASGVPPRPWLYRWPGTCSPTPAGRPGHSAPSHPLTGRAGSGHPLPGPAPRSRSCTPHVRSTR